MTDRDGGTLLDRRYVRVRKTRANGIVEFDFAIGAPEIFVELLMPAEAFARFCADNAVIDLTGTAPDADDFDARLAREQAREQARTPS